MAMFGSGYHNQGLLGGAIAPESKWLQALSILGATLQDIGAAENGRPGFALPMYQQNLQRLGDQKKYQEMLGQLSAPGTASVTPPSMTFVPPQPSTAPKLGPNREIMPENIDPGQLQINDPGSLNASPAGPLADPRFAAMLPFLQGMDAEKGLPLAFNAMQDAQTADRQDARYTQEQAALARRPATAEEKVKYGLDPLTPAEIDGRGNITPISDPRAITPYQQAQIGLSRDQLNATIRGQNLTDARARETAGRSSAPSGYRARSDGSLEFIPGGPADPAVAGRGTGKPTEDQAKNSQLYTRAKTQLPVALKNFGELAKGKNQFFAGVGEARVPFTNIGIPKGWVTGSEYQQAEGAVKDIATSYLYSVSGATATPSEIAGTVERVMPKMGDSADTVAQKKQRLTEMVESIKLRASPQVLNNAANSTSTTEATKTIGGKTYIQRNGQWYEQ